MAKRLVLLDSHAIIHRAYHALPQTLTNRQGQPINAVYGFARILLKVVEDLKPDYLLATFDLPAPTFRHKAFVGYQAHRPPMEDNLSSQLQPVKELVDVFKIPRFEKAGFEADDLIGTLSTQAAEKNVQAFIVTGDKDILQLVTPKVWVYLMRRGLSEVETLDPKGVEQLLGVKPEQVVDYKALVGDSSDNYPGVPGVGPKTAEKLLAQFPSVKKIYKNLDQIEDRVRAKLEAGRASADLSYQLAEIIKDAPVKLNLKKCRFQFDRKGVSEYFAETGFKSLAKKVTPPKPPPGGKKNSSDQLSFLGEEG